MSFDNLPVKAQMALINYVQNNPKLYQNRYGFKPLETLTPAQLINLLLIIGNIIVKTEKFKVGDTVCAKAAIDRGILLVFQAGDYDVYEYSNIGLTYYKFL